jgi:putative addiction module component (TIGR02574 family)
MEFDLDSEGLQTVTGDATMAPSTEQLLQAALALSLDERDELIEALIAAASPPDMPSIDDAWRAVIQRRSAELDSGTVATVPWSEVRQRVHQRLGLDD